MFVFLQMGVNITLDVLVQDSWKIHTKLKFYIQALGSGYNETEMKYIYVSNYLLFKDRYKTHINFEGWVRLGQTRICWVRFITCKSFPRGLEAIFIKGGGAGGSSLVYLSVCERSYKVFFKSYSVIPHYVFNLFSKVSVRLISPSWVH